MSKEDRPGAAAYRALSSLARLQTIGDVYDVMGWQMPKTADVIDLDRHTPDGRRGRRPKLSEYMRAVLLVRDSPNEYHNQTQWSEAIVRHVEGATSGQAALNMFRNQGYIKGHETSDDYELFRERIEKAAEKMRENGEI